MLVQTTGTSMWPALRTGDLLFGHPLGAGRSFFTLGSVLVVQGPHGLIAHRLVRVAGRTPARRFFLAGDLSGPDLPFAEAEIRGVARARYRKGEGFRDLPPALGLGPLGQRLLTPIARLYNWAHARARERDLDALK